MNNETSQNKNIDKPKQKMFFEHVLTHKQTNKLTYKQKILLKLCLNSKKKHLKYINPINQVATLYMNELRTTFVFKSGWFISTPLSTIPIVTPLPVNPDSHASTIFIDGLVALCYIVKISNNYHVLVNDQTTRPVYKMA